MVALNRETQNLDTALIAAVRGGAATMSQIMVEMSKSEEWAVREAPERKVAKRLEALRRLGALSQKSGAWGLAAKAS